MVASTNGMARRRSLAYRPGLMKHHTWWNSRGADRNTAAQMDSRIREKNGSVRLVKANGSNTVGTAWCMACAWLIAWAL